MKQEYDCPVCCGEGMVIDPEDDRPETCETCGGTGHVTVEVET